jgi:acyl-CoA thioester hydrolase
MPSDVESVWHRHTFRLAYADTDPAGLVYFAAWFPWMERAQSEWFQANDLRQHTLAERFGFSTVVRRAECDYLAPARLYDEITHTVSLGEIRHRSFTTEHRMERAADGVLVARASVVIVTVDQQGRPTEVPEDFRHRLTHGTRP